MRHPQERSWRQGCLHNKLLFYAWSRVYAEQLSSAATNTAADLTPLGNSLCSLLAETGRSGVAARTRVFRVCPPTPTIQTLPFYLRLRAHLVRLDIDEEVGVLVPVEAVAPPFRDQRRLPRRNRHRFPCIEPPAPTHRNKTRERNISRGARGWVNTGSRSKAAAVRQKITSAHGVQGRGCHPGVQEERGTTATTTTTLYLWSTYNTNTSTPTPTRKGREG